MFSKKYRLSYLPLFYKDLDEKATYIAEKLKNPKAANDLLDKVESAVMERLPMAESFEPYHSVRERRYSYYRIYVDNYITCELTCELKVCSTKKPWNPTAPPALPAVPELSALCVIRAPALKGGKNVSENNA